MRIFGMTAISAALFCLTGAAAGKLISLEPCTFETTDQQVDAECGVMEVPETHFGESKSNIRMPFVRFACTGPEKHTTLVYLAGGPGGSGIGTAKSQRFHMFMKLREVADVIVVDQRGTGAAEPKLSDNTKWEYPLDRPMDLETFERISRERAVEARRRFDERGINLDHYNTKESAADIDALRRVLGLDKISLWGTSYGTHLSLAIVRYHEPGVDRVILSGCEGPDHTFKLPSTIDRYLDIVGELMRDDPKVGAAIPNLRGLLETILSDLDRTPARVNVGRGVEMVVGPYDVQRYVANAIGRRTSLPQLPRALLEMKGGNYRRVGRTAYSSRIAGLGSGMSWAMDCASGATPERRARIEREGEATLLGNAVNAGYFTAASAWGVPDLGDDFRSPVRSEVPVLFVSGSIDSRTPPENATEVRAGFPNSYHVIVERGGHDEDMFSLAPGLDGRMKTFLAGDAPSEESIPLPPVKWGRLP